MLSRVRPPEGTGKAMQESETAVEAETTNEATPSREKSRIRVVIAGATGYAGRELITLVVRHPFARLTRLMSSGRLGSDPRPIEQSHPVLREAGSRLGLWVEPLEIEALTASGADVVFLATPHETALEVVPALLDRGLRVIDLSGAFRLKDAAAYPRWYGFEHRASGALGEAVYGMPELDATSIRQARLVSNPGCYATAAILALAPLVRAGWADSTAGIICDAKSGASGAGRAPSEKLHFAEVNENCRAYGLFSHRHVPEILQALGLEERSFVFTPHLLPVTRGILSTIYTRLRAPRELVHVLGLYREFYANAPLVRVYEAGDLPEIQAVAHTNFMDLGFALDRAGERLIVVGALDNLGKGAAGQAIENMNLMFGFPEDAGLG